jgi:hypothetical protein
MTQHATTDSGAIRSADVPPLRYGDPHAEIIAMKGSARGSSLEGNGGTRIWPSGPLDVPFAHDFAQARSRKGAKLRIKAVAKAKG